MLRVYRLRRQSQRLRIAEQQRQVAESQRELQERAATVSSMRRDIADSIAQMATDSSSVDASVIVAAERYRRWVKHDLEREEHYLEMTRGELAEKQQELERINHELRKLETKMDELTRRQKQAIIRQDVLAESRLEEATEALSFVTAGKLNGR
jgi:uncharacterized coiled-coil DUF342 family protein